MDAEDAGAFLQPVDGLRRAENGSSAPESFGRVRRRRIRAGETGTLSPPWLWKRAD
jgi:hypothetical protein